MLTKKLFFGPIAVFLLLVIGYSLYSLAQPTVVITVQGTHSPIDNYIFLDGKRLFPEGEGGKTYKVKTHSGKHIIGLSGPFIEDTRTDISLSFFNHSKLEITGTARSAEKILKDVYGDQNTPLKNTETHGKVILSEQVELAATDEGSDKNHSIATGYDRIHRSWIKLEYEGLTRDDYRLDQEILDRFYGI